MIATGTDIRPIEIVFFMRMVRSRTFFEQMQANAQVRSHFMRGRCA